VAAAPVVAGVVAAPDPPPRVPAPEPVKCAVPVIRARAGGHLWCLRVPKTPSVQVGVMTHRRPRMSGVVALIQHGNGHGEVVVTA
jgi:hypothetical protein